MADSKRLAEWLIFNADLLDLRATIYEWPNEWKIRDVFDIQVSIKLGGQSFIGRGTSKGEELAFIKAGAEAIERAYCARFGFHSTGVAVHTDKSMAASNALNELFERRAFYAHFYTKTPFLPLNAQDIESQYPETFRKIVSHGVSLKFFRALTTGRLVILAVASGVNATHPWGGIMGLAAGENEGETIDRAFLECLRNIAAVIQLGVKRTLSSDEFHKIQEPIATDRQALALNKEFWKSAQYLFPELCNSEIFGLRQAIKWQSMPENNVSMLENPFPELKNAPIFVCRAQDHEKEFFCERDKSPITKKHLQDFMGGFLRADLLETAPSFLG